jgi:hypothetical protein
MSRLLDIVTPSIRAERGDPQDALRESRKIADAGTVPQTPAKSECSTLNDQRRICR